MKNDISRLDGRLNVLLRRMPAVAAVAAASDVSLIYKEVFWHFGIVYWIEQLLLHYKDNSQ